jgi:hypothetical protein
MEVRNMLFFQHIPCFLLINNTTCSKIGFHARNLGKPRVISDNSDWFRIPWVRTLLQLLVFVNTKRLSIPEVNSMIPFSFSQRPEVLMPQ